MIPPLSRRNTTCPPNVTGIGERLAVVGRGTLLNLKQFLDYKLAPEAKLRRLVGVKWAPSGAAYGAFLWGGVVRDLQFVAHGCRASPMRVLA